MGRFRQGCRPRGPNSFPWIDPQGAVLRWIPKRHGGSYKNKRTAQTLVCMSDAFHYFQAHAVRALCKARAMPLGRMRHLQVLIGRIYHLLTKEAAFGPNLHHMDDFRAAQKLEKSLDSESASSKAVRPPGGSKRLGGDGRPVSGGR